MGSWSADPLLARVTTAGSRAVVVGLDDSPTSLRALDYAVGLARREDSRVLAVHVRSSRRMLSPLDIYDFTSCPAAQAALDAQDALEETLRSEVDQLEQVGRIGIELVFRRGDPVRELTTIARDACADSIVVGCSSRLASRLAGSLVARLVRHRACPVIVVP